MSETTMETNGSVVLSVLAQKQAEALAEKEAAQQALEAENRRRHRTIVNGIGWLWGDMRMELDPFVTGLGHSEDKKGLWTSAQFRIDAETLQIAPIMITCTLALTHEYEYKLSFTCDLADGQRGQQWHQVTPEEFTDVLLAAHQAYPAWKAGQEEIERRKAAEEERQRQQQISNLCYHYCWTADNNTEEDVLNRYEKLKVLTPSLAEEKLAYYRQSALEWAAAKEQQRIQQEANKVAKVEYERAMTEWRQACWAWAENETARLWQPWALWEVRYVPACPVAVRDEDRDDLIVTISTLDAPQDFVLSKTFYCVDMVSSRGQVTEGFTFATFLDAKPIHYTEPDVNHHLAHHRSFSAGGYVVNVPAYELEDPIAAPVEPVCPEGYEWTKDDGPF